MGASLRRAALGFLLLTLAGCGGGEEPARLSGLSFEADRIRLTLSRMVFAEEVQVLSPEGQVLLRRGLAGRLGREFRVEFPWQPGEPYRVRLLARGGPWAEGTLRAPASPPAPFALSIEIPHGLASPRAFLPAGAAFHATLKAVSPRAGAGGFEATLRLPPGVEVEELEEGWRASSAPGGGGFLLSAEGRLEAAGDIWFRQVKLRLPARAGGALPFEAGLRPKGGLPPVSARAEVRLRPAGELRRAVRLERAVLPTDEEGNADPFQLPDTMLLPGGPGHFLLALTGRGGPPVNPFFPYRHQTLWLRNASGGALAVTVSSRVLLAGSGREAAFFRAPDLISGGSGQSVAFAALPAGGTAPVVLPIFLDPREAAAGRYVRRVQVRLLGTETDLLKLDLPLELRRPSLRAFLVTAATLSLALLGGVFLAWRGGRAMRAMPLRMLTGAAMFAAASFALVSLPEFLVGSSSRLLLGPFSFLVTGLFSHVPLYALAAAYLMRYPVPGALALFAAIRKLILALTLESFQIIPVLILAAEIACLEGAAWLAGITRGAPGRRLLDRWPEERWRPAAAAGLAFVAADLLLTGASIHLHIFFYRLILADWYILLYLAVASVLYTFIGFTLGLRLGAPLREVAG
ncbi:MAG: hypothetical protein A3J27_05050 [Candidatus Tectomicrobia bacterium RIFCSPLOWO2_12_FULL_69_37]|nr:MAG: hypothetical protein A3J27_05050 [Candidatus Tectomicrobia bacterium RIFCSPLOWO2_12_FULL_69_37]